MKAQTLVDALADSLAEVKAEKLTDTLAEVKVLAPFDALADWPTELVPQTLSEHF